MARERLPATPVEPLDLQQAVDLSDAMNKYKTSPIDTVQVLSKGLNRFANVQLTNIAWISSIDPNVDISGKKRTDPNNQNSIGFSDVSFTDTGYLFYHIAVVDGFLEPFDGDYRKAIAAINDYAEQLRKENAIHDVSIIKLPLDVSSATSMQGSLQSQAKSANFSLRLVIGVGNDA